MNTVFTYDSQIVSDLHKDARGFRPSLHWMVEWDRCTPSGKQRIWDALLEEVEASIALERAQEAAAEQAFAQRIDQALAMGAADTATAVRWVIDGEGVDAYDLRYGASYVEYRFDLSYRNCYHNLIEQACASLLAAMET